MRRFQHQPSYVHALTVEIYEGTDRSVWQSQVKEDVYETIHSAKGYQSQSHTSNWFNLYCVCSIKGMFQSQKPRFQ